jgi:ACT domain-containing protein
MSVDADGVQSYTVRLELVDEPGELLRALEPISEHGGNLLSIFHERGSMTPRGHIPVEVDVECPPERFDAIVDALRDAGVNVIRAGAEAYDDSVTVLLTGSLIQADLSGTLSRIEADADATVTDVSLSAPEGTQNGASARLRLAADAEHHEAVLDVVRDVADGKDLQVIEPLIDGRGGGA